ncbi:zona pellucida sperm-binding protein 3b [Polymixia lowei]
MDLQQSSPWWIIALLTVSTLTESQITYRPGSSKKVSLIPNTFNVHTIPPAISPAKKQIAEPTVRPPTLRRAVVVKCHADSMEVVVQADLFDTGLLVDGRYLHLGSDSVSFGGTCGAVPSGEEEFTIQAHLMDCGTKLSSTNETIIYSNVLVYSPEPSSDGVLRLDGANIPVECHYAKRYAVDGIALRPTWIPYVSRATAEDIIDFNLRLMTDDWLFERGSQAYFVGYPIHLEVSVIMGNHISLRVYVDHCVATATADAEAALKYDFIDHHGCLSDAYLTSSSSRFLPRVQEDKLRFQLDAFKFYQEHDDLIYITCYVKAVPATLDASSQNRACSFIDNRWQSVDGNDQACRSCELSQRYKEPRPTEPPTTTTQPITWAAMTTQGNAAWSGPKQHQAGPFRFYPDRGQAHPVKPLPSSISAGVMKRGANSRAEWNKTTRLGPLVILPAKVFTTTVPTVPT